MLLPILGVLALLSLPVVAVIVSRRDRQPEIPATPIDWGVGSQLPDGAIRLAPISFGHPANCTQCKHQAPNIPAA